MKKNKTSQSQASSYEEIGRYWDTHDLSKCWDKTKKADFRVSIETEITYYAVDREISEAIQKIANQRGIPADTLVNLWMQEKLKEQHL